jgi:hypothetical protein
MKNQNVNKLAFAKTALVELNDNELNGVNGGSTPSCFAVSLGMKWYYELTEPETLCGPN